MKSTRSLLFAAIVAVALFSTPARGQNHWPGDGPYPLKATLNSMQVVPANGSMAGGRCRATGEFLDGETASIAPAYNVVCDFWGLSGPLVDVDIRSARRGENGGGLCEQEKRVTVTLPNTGSGTATIGCVGPGGPFAPAIHLKHHYIVLQTALYPDGEIRGQIRPSGYDIDVDGEGRAEVSLFRPGDGLAYSFSDIGNKALLSQLNWWNPATDSVPFLSDFDGDGIADWATTRTAQNGRMETLWLSSAGNYIGGCGFGNTAFGDVYAYGDYNGNGTTDCALFRTSTGEWWFYDHAASGQTPRKSWGGPGAATPCPGDYDADGKTDLCLIRPEAGRLVWSIQFSLGGEATIPWGLTTDEVFTTMPADFNSDGASEIYIARVENGQRYFWIYDIATWVNGDVIPTWEIRQWGLATDTVKVADYDGDGVSDLAAIRETDGHLVWYISQSSDGQMHVDHWGLPGDK